MRISSSILVCQIPWASLLLLLVYTQKGMYLDLVRPENYTCLFANFKWNFVNKTRRLE